MTFSKALQLTFIKNYFNFQGRSSRTEYLYSYLFIFIFYIISMTVIDSSMYSDGLLFFTLLILLFYLYSIIPMISLGIRRLHDTNLSGFYFLLGIIPIVGAVILIYLCAIKVGDKGTNQFGPNPLEEIDSNVINSSKNTSNEISKNTVVERKIEKTTVEHSNPISLQILNGSLRGRKYKIIEDTSLGRASDNEIVFDEPTISSNHCEITIKEEEFRIKDLNSTNGTYLNGKKVKNVKLKDNDIIKISNVEIKVIR